MAWTGRAHGHLGLPRDTAEADSDSEGVLAARRSALVAGSWSWLHQVHGADVVTVGAPGGGRAGDGDALVTSRPAVVLAVFTADCAPIALASPEGVVGLAHAGWRGLIAGVVERTVDAMRALGAGSVAAALGPCIRAGCYEFGADDLDLVASWLGDEVRATTSWGTPALDLAAAVGSALNQAGAELLADAGACTACSAAWFSYRARGDTARQATAVWVPE